MASHPSGFTYHGEPFSWDDEAHAAFNHLIHHAYRSHVTRVPVVVPPAEQPAFNFFLDGFRLGFLGVPNGVQLQ